MDINPNLSETAENSEKVEVIEIPQTEAPAAEVPQAVEVVEAPQPETPRPIGRPSDYTKEIGDKICAKLSEGISLRTVCLADDMPDKATVFRWLRIHKDFCDQYVRAKEESADAHLETIEDLGDEAIKLSQEVDPKSSSAVVQAVKLKSDNLKWVMSKMKPKKYGETLDLTTQGEKLPTPIYGGHSIKPTA